MSKRTITLSKSPEDEIPVIEGECPNCKRGQNSLIIYQNKRNPSVKQRNNNILFICCIACRHSYKTDLQTLISS
jgi:hypothetical protein